MATAAAGIRRRGSGPASGSPSEGPPGRRSARRGPHLHVRDLHPIEIDPAEARAIRVRLAPRVGLEDADALDDVRAVAGIDNDYVKRDGGETIAHAAVVVLSFPGLEPIETAVASRPVAFPSVPGLRSFREAPAVLAA